MTRDEKATCVHEAKTLIASLLGIIQNNIHDTGQAHLASLNLEALLTKIEVLGTN